MRVNASERPATEAQQEPFARRAIEFPMRAVAQLGPIYTGLRNTPEMVVEAALQEDVDAIGVSILSGAHMTIFPRVLALMKEKGLEDVLLFGGGIIPEKDIQELKRMGVGELFTPGAPTTAIVEYLRTRSAARTA